MDLNFPPPFDLNEEPDDYVIPIGEADWQDVAGNQNSTGDFLPNAGPSHNAANQNASASGGTHGSDNEALSGNTLSSDDSGSEDDVDSTPTLGTPQTPFIDMIFDSEPQARRQYNRYAHNVGFSIKTGSSKKSAITKKKFNVLYVCNKSGKQVDTEKTANTVKQRFRSRTKLTDCKARLRVKKVGDRWRVTMFTEEHNHPLIKKFSLKKFLRSHRKIPKEEKDFIRWLHTVNIPAGRIMSLIAELYGGRSNVPYDDKDVSNVKASINAENRHKDVAALLALFAELKTEDPDFFYKIELDHVDRVVSIFWVDGPAIAAYKLYFDCMSFDTTYLTNMYNMPCAPFIGINRYGQTIQLGCAFLRDEKFTSFKWLFEAFLEAMGGQAPTNMITDQDVAMGLAIEQVFPATVHRCCRWHIMQKAQQKIGNFLARRNDLRLELNEAINYSLTPEEFEHRWADMVATHNVADHENLLDLYDLRRKFVPAYFRHNFFPFLQTTSRSEGFNAVVKKYQSPQNSLVNFFRQYQKIQEKIETVGDGKEFDAEDKEVTAWSNLPVEQQAMSFYTRPVYMLFRTELRRTTAYKITLLADHIYELELRTGCFIYDYGARSYKVTAIPQNNSYDCECCKMSRDGILCCHVLAVMQNLGVDAIPACYLIERWSQPNDEFPLPEAPVQIPQNRKPNQKEMKLIRYSNMCNDFAKIAKQACTSEKSKAIVASHMAAMIADLDEVKKTTKGKRKKPTVQEKQNAGTSEAPPQAKDPRRSKPKGRPADKRKKSGIELQPPRPVTCSLCEQNGHTSTTCPARFGAAQNILLPNLLR